MRGKKGNASHLTEEKKEKKKNLMSDFSVRYECSESTSTRCSTLLNSA